MNINTEQLIQWNQLGIIPGPGETEEEYLARGRYLLSLKKELGEALQAGIPFSSSDSAGENILKEAFCLTQALYDIRPSWIPVYFSDYKLSCWHGGCAWIFQITEDSPKAALIQLRQAFRNKKRYLRLYSRQELIVHELSHAGRLAFEEPTFEEFFAYLSATSSFRKCLGPIVQNSKESLAFVATLAIALLLQLFFAGSNPWLYLLACLLPVSLLLLGLIRLFFRRKQFEKCLKNLEQIVENTHQAQAIRYRLTDEEIIAFSRMKKEELAQYMKEKAASSFRWKAIAASYLKPF